MKKIIPTAALCLVFLANIILPGLAQDTERPEAGALTPILECVVRVGDGSFRARFGYLNEGSPVTIPVGFFNQIIPGAQNQGQVTAFQSGRVVNAFEVPISGRIVAWVLTGPDNVTRVASATNKARDCSSPVPTPTPTPTRTATPTRTPRTRATTPANREVLAAASASAKCPSSTITALALSLCRWALPRRRLCRRAATGPAPWRTPRPGPPAGAHGPTAAGSRA